MPDLTRTFAIPGLTAAAAPLAITLHEPSLTADDLGHKTWTASYLLARRLCAQPIPPFAAFVDGAAAGAPRPRVLELGAGTGLLGLALAAHFPVNMDLTDLPAIVPNLAANVRANQPLLDARGSMAVAFALDWGRLPLLDDEKAGDEDARAHSYRVVVAADPIYGPEHPALLAAAIDRYLERTQEARLVIELPTREAYGAEVAELKSRLRAARMVLLESGEEIGYDDWGGGSVEVNCEWSIWARDME